MTRGPLDQCDVLGREPISDLSQEGRRNRNCLVYFIRLHLERSAVLAVAPIAQGVQLIELVFREPDCLRSGEPGSALSF